MKSEWFFFPASFRLQDTVYYQNAKYMFSKALAANNAGDYFPVWGSDEFLNFISILHALYSTCMGFQLLHILASNNHSILTDGFRSSNLALPLDFTTEAAASRMLGKATTPSGPMEV